MAIIEEIMDGNVPLIDTEEYMRAIEKDIRTGFVHLAISLGAIRKYRLFLDVAQSWPEYIARRRTTLNPSTAYSLAQAGENYLQYRKELETYDIKMRGNKEKIRIIDHRLAREDPMFFQRLKDMSFKQFQVYQEEQRGVYIDVYNDNSGGVPVSIKGSGIYVGDKKIKGINLNDVKHNLSQGKRAFVVWIDDTEASYKRAKRAVERSGIGEKDE